MRIAVIPARGGSKRIPRKNIKPFYGKPMIAWSIEAAINAKCFDRVIVSTDDDEIADISSTYGAEIPFRRPKHLADDSTPTTPVIAHAIQALEKEGIEIDHACCIYATAPFIRSKDLRLGIEMLEKCGDFVFPVTSFPFPIQRGLRRADNGCIEMLWPENFTVRSQDLEESFHDAGQFYWGTREAWVDQKPIFLSHTYPIILPRYRVQDIDTFEDWECAETIANSIFNRSN